MKQTVRWLERLYKEILQMYLIEKNERSLYKAQQFSKLLLERQISPEELISIHRTVLTQLFPSSEKGMIQSFDFLLEVMIGYGLAYREHQVLRDRQQELDSEIAIAADMQQTLLPTSVPKITSLDIGVITVPANQMSGDYFNYILEEESRLGIAIADIIGKGIPAALCMSMIKYAMDSLSEQRLQPAALLENLNRVVENNVDDSMFVTMMYGLYDLLTHTFYYSGAGHEPGFFYNYKQNKFYDLYAKGFALGLTKKATFQQCRRKVDVGDMIILVTDGVTECRVNDTFIDRPEVVTFVRKYMHLSAQNVVENVYKELERLQDFTLTYDFTLMLIKRKV